MNLRIRFAGVAMIAVFFGCAPTTSLHPPSGWVEMDLPNFVISIPPDIKPAYAPGVVSLISTYMGDSISMEVDAGPHSDPLENAGGGMDYASHEERIGGRKARIASFNFPQGGRPFEHAMGIYFPRVAEKDVRLTVFAMCKTEANYETIRKMFRTIRFK